VFVPGSWLVALIRVADTHELILRLKAGWLRIRVADTVRLIRAAWQLESGSLTPARLVRVAG
jgi:hypothetical protein